MKPKKLAKQLRAFQKKLSFMIDIKEDWECWEWLGPVDKHGRSIIEYCYDGFWFTGHHDIVMMMEDDKFNSRSMSVLNTCNNYYCCNSCK